MAKVSSQVIGTVKKYQNSIAIKKHNAIVRAWAAPCARDVAAVFWSTWKDIESRIPTSADGDFREADQQMTAAEKRALKNKYTAATKAAVNAASPQLERVLREYNYKVFVASMVETARKHDRLGEILEWKTNRTISESSGMAEASVVWAGKFSLYNVGVLTDDDGKSSWVAEYQGTMHKFSPTNGVSSKIIDAHVDDEQFSDEYMFNIIELPKNGGQKLPTAKQWLKQNGYGHVAATQKQKSYSFSKSASSVSPTPNASSKLSKPKKKSVKASGAFSLPNYKAQKYANDHAAEAVSQINATTRGEIARIVQQGIENGTSYGDIAKAINTKFKDFAVPQPQKHIANRGVLVAVTELANAYCEANLQTASMLQDSGVQMMKAWLTMEDSRVSDGCEANQNAGWIPLDQEFPSGHARPPRFPGCRCDMLTDMLDEQALGLPIGSEWSEDRLSLRTEVATEKKGGTPDWKKWEQDYSLTEEISIGRRRHRIELEKVQDPRNRNMLQNSFSWWDSIPEDQQESIEQYTGSSYIDMNELLRTGGEHKGRIWELCKNAHDGLNSYIMQDDAVFHRGFYGEFWDDWEEGQERTISEFLSTAVGSGFSGCHHVYFYVHAGSQCGAFVAPFSRYADEEEFLLNSGNNYLLHHRERNHDGGYDFYVEVLGQPE